MKRCIGLLLVFCMVIAMLPFSVLATEVVASGTCGENLIWTLDEEGTLTISGEGAMDGFALESPQWEEYEEDIIEIIVRDGVTTIGGCAFGQCDNLLSVTLPSSLIEIQNSAFYHCDKLSKISFGSGLQRIGESAFRGCESIQSLEIPNSVTEIEGYAFDDCTNLSAISLSHSLKVISTCMLDGCERLNSIDIPHSVIEIQYSAFRRCRNIKSVIIPKSVKKLGESIFHYCDRLETVTFQGNAPDFDENAFEEIESTIYYPEGDDTWTSDVMLDYGGNVEWISYCKHEYTSLENYQEPSCEETGYSGDEVCSLCGNTIKNGDIIQAIGHNYRDGICANCGRGEIIRIFGSGRCETAIEVADKLKEVLDVDTFDAIIIANGDKFADALSGSYLAAVKNAPILLRRDSGAGDDLNEEYILGNLSSGGIVYVLGGTASVPDSVVERLEEQGVTIKRLFGNTRFETNLKILEEAGIGNQEILISSGWEYADALSASATGLPILILNTKNNELTESQVEFLEKHADNKFTVLGGTVAVSAELQAIVTNIVGDVDRVYGDIRETTSVAVAERYCAESDCVLIAYSRKFPDGLCGGPLAHALGAPLLLTNSGKESAAAEYIADHSIYTGYILGGTTGVSDASVEIIFG